MKNETKKYCQYFIRSNLKFIVMETILLFIAMPFAILNTKELDIEYTFGRGNLIRVFGINTTFCAIVLAILIPMVVYRFLYKRKSCDLYFSLPIKRKQLFSLQYCLGFLMAIIPFTLNFILALIVFYMKNTVTIENSIFPYFILVYIIIFTLYSLISLVLVKCNNMLDAVLVSIGIVIVPIILFITAQLFLTLQMDNIFVTQSGSFNEIFDISLMFTYITPIICIFYYVSEYLLTVQSHSISMIIIPMLYWFMVGSVFLYASRKAFLERKEEDSEQRTKSFLTYPINLVLGIIALTLGTFRSDVMSSDMIVSIVIIFVIYVVVIFIWKRRIQLRVKEIASFILLYAVVISFSIVFQNTKGFGVISEVPNEEGIKKVKVSLNIDNYFEEDYVTNQFVNDNSLDTNFINHAITYDDKDKIHSIVKIQKDLISIGRAEDIYSTEASIVISYDMKNGQELYRYYNIYNSNGYDKLLDVYDILSKFN